MSDDPQENGKLQDRVEHAIGWHDTSRELRNGILDGVYQAGGLGEVSWDELPPHVQKLIEEAEALPQTGWDDPADVPEDLVVQFG
ncbi:MAG: hypothetical protein ABW360_02745 [Phenylobacterium sp.]